MGPAGGAGVRLRGRRPRAPSWPDRGRPLVAAAAARSGCSRFGAATACGLQARYAAADLAGPEHRGRDLSSSSGRRRSARCSAPTWPGRAPTWARRWGCRRSAAPSPSRRRCSPLVAARLPRACSGPTRCCSPAGSAAVALGRAPARRDRGRRPRGLGLAGRPARADRRGRLPRGDGRRHGHDAGAHGPRRRPEGTTLRIIGLVISVHVAGMYLFSPLIGWLADRFGRRRRSPSARRCCCSAAAALAGTAAARCGRPAGRRVCCCSASAGPAG